jgi:hypothetical protein
MSDKKVQETSTEPTFEFTKELVDQARRDAAKRSLTKANLVTGDVVSGEEDHRPSKCQPSK